MYPAVLCLFVVSLGAVLVALVDIRRGFLLSEYDLANPWVSLSVNHLWWLGLGLAGLAAAYSCLRRWETRKEADGERLRSLGKITLFALVGLLAIDTLFLYRGLAAARIVEAGRVGIGALGLAPGQLPGQAELFPLASTPIVLRPVAIAANYLALVWHATLLALLWAGLGVVALPLYFHRLVSPRGASRFRSLMGGVVYAIPQPFCSCCAAPIAATIYRSGTPLVASVAFLLSSPTLNITALILAATLLPWPFAALRIVGGGLLVVAAAYLAAGLAGRVAAEAPSEPRGVVGFLTRVFNRYCALFQIDPVSEKALTPAGLIAAWTSGAWRVARVIVPTLAVGSVLGGAVVTFFPFAFENDVLGVVLAAAFGTLLMVSTWTEIPVASVLASQGLTGPAAALLITLPVVSLPCLIILGGALAGGRVPVVLGLATFAFGAIAGLLFL